MEKEELKKPEDNSFGVCAVIFGILSIVLSSGNGIGITLGVIGLIFGVKQKKIRKNGWSKTGLILNIIGILLGIVFLIYTVTYIINNPELISQLQGQLTNAR